MPARLVILALAWLPALAWGQPFSVMDRAFLGNFVFTPTTTATDFGLPPTNSFVWVPDNPCVFTGNANAHNVLAERIIYDAATGKFFKVGTINTGTTGVGLFQATNACVAKAWSYVSNCVNGGSSVAPDLVQYGGTNFLYVDQETNVICYTSTNIYGPWTSRGEMIRTNGTGWASARVKEVWFQPRNGTDYTNGILFFMGDAGGQFEQVSYATTTNGPLGTWNKYNLAGGPFFPYGATNTYDSRTVADMESMWWNGAYYFIYAAQQFTNIYGYTMLGMAVSSDLTNVTRLGVLVPTNSTYPNILRGGILQTCAPGFSSNRLWCLDFCVANTAVSICDTYIATCPADARPPNFTFLSLLQTNASTMNLTYWTDINSRGAAAYGTAAGTYSWTNIETAATRSNLTHTVVLTNLATGSNIFAVAQGTNIVSGNGANSSETNCTVFAWPTYTGNHYSTNNGATSSTKTIGKLPSNTTAGSLVVLSLFLNSASATPTITDTLGLTWTKATNCLYNTASQQLMTYYATNASAGLLRVTNTTSSLDYSGMSLVEFTNILAYQPVDAFATNSGSSTGGVTISSPVTTSQPGDLIYSAWASPSTTWTAGGGYTIRETQLTCEDGVSAPAGIVNATATPDGVNNFGVNVVAFKHK